MFPYLIILFTLLPALELFVLIKVGAVIGAGNTILIIILTGFWGAYLARLQGFLVLQKIQENQARGQMPASELVDGVLILVGGIVLLTPGFITDLIGFLLLIPLTRALIKIWVKKHFENAIKQGNIHSTHIHHGNQPPTEEGYDDIDV